MCRLCAGHINYQSSIQRLSKTSIGVDFGASNTVVSLATADGRVETLRFPHCGAAEAPTRAVKAERPREPGLGLSFGIATLAGAPMRAV